MRLLLRPIGQRSAQQEVTIWSFQINISVIKAPIPTNEVSMFKLNIEKHFESDYQGSAEGGANFNRRVTGVCHLTSEITP